MICARCDQPILAGEAYDSEAIDGASAAGGTVILHRRLCDRPPTQTAPERGTSAYWWSHYGPRRRR